MPVLSSHWGPNTLHRVSWATPLLPCLLWSMILKQPARSASCRRSWRQCDSRMPHAVEREQAEVLSSRQMMEQAALRYGLDIFGLESARVFQDGWHMRDQELH